MLCFPGFIIVAEEASIPRRLALCIVVLVETPGGTAAWPDSVTGAAPEIVSPVFGADFPADRKSINQSINLGMAA